MLRGKQNGNAWLAQISSLGLYHRLKLDAWWPLLLHQSLDFGIQVFCNCQKHAEGDQRRGKTQALHRAVLGRNGPKCSTPMPRRCFLCMVVFRLNEQSRSQNSGRSSFCNDLYFGRINSGIFRYLANLRHFEHQVLLEVAGWRRQGNQYQCTYFALLGLQPLYATLNTKLHLLFGWALEYVEKQEVNVPQKQPILVNYQLLILVPALRHLLAAEQQGAGALKHVRSITRFQWHRLDRGGTLWWGRRDASPHLEWVPAWSQGNRPKRWQSRDSQQATTFRTKISWSQADHGFFLDN